MAKTVDSSDAAEVGWLLDEGEIVSLIGMLLVVLSVEIVLLSTTIAYIFKKSLFLSTKTLYPVR